MSLSMTEYTIMSNNKWEKIMDIKREYQNLVSVQLSKENLEHFLSVAQYISGNYFKSRKENIQQVRVKIPNGTQIKQVYNEQYQAEQSFLVLFYHKYANMINRMNTPCEIGAHVETRSFLTPAHYSPENKNISYQLEVIMREKSSNLANVLELCMHENRHAMQFEAFSKSNPEELLEFDANSIFILKDYLVMLNGHYAANHINSLMEIDANLYARGISRQLVSKYFSEHQEGLKYTDFAWKEKTTDNPFEEIEDGGLITGEYKLPTGEKSDRAIMMDKNLRNLISPQLVEQFPMLKLIWKDGNFKTYAEIMQDKQELMQRLSGKTATTIISPSYDEEPISEKEKVERLYDAIVQSDPMLYLESLLSKSQIPYMKVKEIFNMHPTLLREYHDQITEVFTRKSTEIDSSQRNIFNRLLSELNINVQRQDESIKHLKISGSILTHLREATTSDEEFAEYIEENDKNQNSRGTIAKEENRPKR